MDILAVKDQGSQYCEYIVHTLLILVSESGLMIAVSECKTKAGEFPFQGQKVRIEEMIGWIVETVGEGQMLYQNS